MPNIISNELTIEGTETDIKQFLDDQFHREKRWTIPHRDEIECDEYGNLCCFRFTTGWDTPRKWLSEVRQKYPSLKFDMFWMDTDDTPCCGIIDSNGEEYNEHRRFQVGM